MTLEEQDQIGFDHYEEVKKLAKEFEAKVRILERNYIDKVSKFNIGDKVQHENSPDEICIITGIKIYNETKVDIRIPQIYYNVKIHKIIERDNSYDQDVLKPYKE